MIANLLVIQQVFFACLMRQLNLKFFVQAEEELWITTASGLNVSM